MTEESRYSFTWGLDLSGYGYLELYGFMLDHYTELGLTNTEMMAIIHLARFHYNTPNSRGSRPGLDTIRKKMGYSDISTVSRLLNGIAEKKLLIIRHRPGEPNQYDAMPFALKAERLFHLERARVLEEAATFPEDDGDQMALDLEGVDQKINPPLDEKIKTPLTKRSTEEQKKEPEGEEEESTYTVEVYYRDKSRVTPAPGRSYKTGPWFVQCPSCDTEVEILRKDGEPVECLCAMHEFVLLSKQPGKPAMHKAVALYRKVSGQRPNAEQIALIEAKIGEDDASLTFWSQIISDYMAQPGWSPKNVEKMVLWYNRKMLPSQSKRQKGRVSARANEQADSDRVGKVHQAV